MIDTTLTDVPAFLDLFEAHAEASPGRVAVVCGDRTLTYGDLDDAARGVAGASPTPARDPATWSPSTSTDRRRWSSRYLGALKAGAAYLPIDPGYPAARIAMVLEDSGAAAALTRPHLRTGLPGSRDRSSTSTTRRRDADGTPSAPERPCLRPLHLRLDRPPQGRA